MNRLVPSLLSLLIASPAVAGTFEEVRSFGGNPGGLKMFRYVPDGVGANAPLVLALHACSQTATEYRKAGWEALADQHKFYVVYPEQQTGNNALRCFNWAGEYSDPTNLRRGEGENQSIKEMVDKMKADFSIDARRVFIMGHSGGAAQTALMLAVWPDVFTAGAMIAGIPYRCTTNFNEVTTCLSPGIDRTAAQWAELGRMGNPGWTGPWPKLSIWHGSSDFTVAIRNLTETLEQFTALHGVDQTEDATDTVGSATRRQYRDGSGDTVVETWTIQSMGHGTPVDTSNGCGQAGQYFLNVGVCAVARIATFWGLDGAGPMPGDTTPPTVDVTAPASGATVSGTVNVTVSASDDTAVTAVEIRIDGVSRATLTAAPWTWAWDTSATSNGPHRISAVARDAAGNEASDDDTTVTVMGGVTDTTAPTVSITAPAAGATVSGAVEVRLEASDDVGVTRVEVSANGARIGEATTAPYAVSWDTTALTPGSFTLSARAYDAAGNEGAAGDVTVTVEAGSTMPTPPSVAFVTPSAGATVKGAIEVEVSASVEAPRTITQVFLFLDGMLIGSDYRGPRYTFLWDTATFPEGPHQLTARAIASDGSATSVDAAITIARAAPESEEPELGEPVFLGKRRWGCSTSPGAGDLGLYFLVLALGLWRRRTRNS
jgi:poly(hydroxyalkanoate) depolymerase family esterase